MIDQPQSATETERNEARARLRAYLRALQVADEEQQERIVANILQRAVMRREASPGESLTALAMDEVRQLSEQWFGILLAGHERIAVTGLVSLFAIDAAEKWPSAFLADEIPADFYRALRECDVRAAPDLQVSRMVPQPFANPLEEAIKLPSPLGALAKDLAPFVSKVFTTVLAGCFVWLSAP